MCVRVHVCACDAHDNLDSGGSGVNDSLKRQGSVLVLHT